MPDIFGRRPLEFGGAFAADSAEINLTGVTNGSGLIAQQVSIQYQQPITRIYEVGTQRTFYIAGRPQGTASIASVLGPGNISTAFFHQIGNVCNAAGNDMTICVKAGCTTQPVPPSAADLAVAASLSASAGAAAGAAYLAALNAATNNFQNFQGILLIVKNIVLQAIGFSVAAQDMVINEQLALFFTSLIACDDACSSTPFTDTSCG